MDWCFILFLYFLKNALNRTEGIRMNCRQFMGGMAEAFFIILKKYKAAQQTILLNVVVWFHEAYFKGVGFCYCLSFIISMLLHYW